MHVKSNINPDLDGVLLWDILLHIVDMLVSCQQYHLHETNYAQLNLTHTHAHTQHFLLASLSR
jgi:hypothetical protein